MNEKMRKKYYIILIVFAVLLIASIIAIGTLTNQLFKKEAENNNYTIGEVELHTIPQECNKTLELYNFSFSKNELTEQKTYSYSTTEGEILIARYVDYLFECHFVQADPTEYLFGLEDKNVSVLLTCDGNQLTITLTHTF